jgi:molybdopterin/thiamine biosynthesis adenylyltransferase
VSDYLVLVYVSISQALITRWRVFVIRDSAFIVNDSTYIAMIQNFFSPGITICSEFLTFGLFISVPGIIGCLQALEAIKIAASVGEPLSGRMLLFDALSARIRIVC